MTDRDAFLRWTCANPFAEEVREAYLHWLVRHALDLDPGATRPDGLWREQILFVQGLSLALASAASIQHPDQREPNPISFRLSALHADCQLLGLLDADRPGLDPFDPNQWRFWLVPSRTLHPDRLSIGLNPLRRSHGDGIPYGALKAEVTRLAHDKAMA